MRRRSKRLALLLALAAFCAASAPAQAEERVNLKNGRTLVGKIEARDEQGFWIRTEIGRMRVDQADVEKIDTVAARRREADQREKPTAAADTAGTPAADAAGAKKPALTGDEAKERQRLIYEVTSGLVSKDEIDRTRASGTILRGWPETAYLVDAALEHKDRRVRLAVVRVLDSKSVTDPRTYLLKALKDKDVLVQVMAVRALRHRASKGVESHLIRKLSVAKPWPVHQEVLRTLEEIGSFRCLETVMANLEKSDDKRLHKAHTRVLKIVLGVDHGKDVEAWRRAVNEFRPPLPGRGRK